MNLARVRLGDIASIQTGPFGSQLHQSDYVENGTPIITVEHLGDDRIRRMNLPRVTDEDKNRLNRYLLKEGDTVFSRVGSVDRASYVHKEEDGWLFSGRCLRVRPEPKKVNPRYLSFYLRSQQFTSYIKSIAVGATMPSINTSLLESSPVLLVNLEQQEKIGHFLDTIERKIELNRRMNETLEQIGQTLFKKYFVDNPESERWSDGVVSDLINVYSGYAFKRDIFDANGDYGLVTIKNVQDGFFVEECTDRISAVPVNVPDYCYLKKGDILLSLTGNVGRVCFVTKSKLLLNQRVAKLSGVGDNSNSFAYFMFRSADFKDRLISISRGTAQMNLSPVETKQLNMKIPPQEMLKEFVKISSPIYKLLIQTSVENSKLSEARDSLLPKLISGEIAV